MSKENAKQITLRLPLEVDEALKEISKVTSINIKGIVVMAILKYKKKLTTWWINEYLYFLIFQNSSQKFFLRRI